MAVKGSARPNRYYVNADGCWIWTGATIKGYGSLRVAQKHYYAHRFHWEMRHGVIPVGLQLDHLCRKPLCCNPDHLEIVTQVENLRRGAKAKFTGREVEEIKKILPFATRARIAKVYRVRWSRIGSIAAGKTWGVK